jgi:hypothetical protein
MTLGCGRLSCAVEGCRRSRLNLDPVFYEWVCQKCYGRASSTVKTEHNAAKAAIRKLRRRHCRDNDTIADAYLRAERAWAAVLSAASHRLPDKDALREMGVL